MKSEKTRTSLERVKRIFLSYDKQDQDWAKWVSWQLEAVGYLTTRCWDLQPGSNREVEWNLTVEQAEHTVALFSPAYLERLNDQPGWSTALAKDPGGRRARLIPVRIQECELPGLFGPITAIDLFDLAEEEVRERLLARIDYKRPKQSTSPVFPGKVQQALPRTAPPFPGNPRPLMKVPYHRNPWFIERDSLLEQLYQHYRTDVTGFPMPLALCGVSGSGKTQIAIEYAYRYGDRYQYILWVQADSRERFGKDVMTLATELSLTGHIHISSGAIQAMKQWLATTGRWLLVLDHVNDLSLVRSCIPQRRKGHILLTTCTQITADVAHCISVEKLTVEERTSFLLNRAKMTNSGSQTVDSAAAQEICQIMDGLPLALDQVGAYIEETNCNLRHYLALYKEQPAMFLKRRGGVKPGYPLSVADVWLQTLAKVEQANPAAAELLRLCAFLGPSGVPEEIITAGGTMLGTTLANVATSSVALDEAIQELRRHSFIWRDPNSMMLSIHPLMQVILQDKMDDNQKRKWAERVVRAVKQVFPDGELPTRQDCQRYVAHVRACVKHISHWEMGFAEAIALIKLEEQILSFLALAGE